MHFIQLQNEANQRITANSVEQEKNGLVHRIGHLGYALFSPFLLGGKEKIL